MNLFGGYPPSGWSAGRSPTRASTLARVSYRLPPAVIANVMKAR